MGMVAMAKAHCSRVAREVCVNAREILGGNGILFENQVMKHVLDIESIYTYEGTYEINTLIAGREILVVSAFK